jgi:hypothetical protein
MYKELFSNITFGGMQSYGSVSALPVSTTEHAGALDYLTLPEAMERMLLRIEEVSESGSVPELKVISLALIPILIISGEEVRGARQNRILNTSILVPAKGEMIIPVSCTERGRWSYTSPDFKDSGNIGSRDVRQAADMSVHHSLKEDRGFRSDQGMVWNKIEELHYKSRSNGTSGTRAMDDAYKSMEDDLEEALRQFVLMPGQTGIMFFHAGKVAGMDIVSRPAAFARLHEKLVKSYLIDCLGQKATKHTPGALLKKAHQFLDSSISGTEKVYKSPGLGEDHRLQSPAVYGSSLVHENEPIHTCCFQTKAEDQRMAGFGRRRDMW